MTDQQPSHQNHNSFAGPFDEIGSDQPRPTRQALVTAGLVAVAVAVVAAAGVGLAGRGGDDRAAAAAGSTSSSPSAGTDRHPGRPFGDGLRGGLGGGPRGALHGTFVVPQADGSGYRTLTTQRGTASRISAASITVRSDDGFEQTYAVAATTKVLASASGVTSIKAGAQVVVLAEASGGAQGALSVADLTNLGWRMGGHFGDRGRHGFGHDRSRHGNSDGDSDGDSDSDSDDGGNRPAPSPSGSTAGTAFRA